MYDSFFTQVRPYNKVMNKVLFSDEVVKNYGKLTTYSSHMAEKGIAYDFKMPP